MTFNEFVTNPYDQNSFWIGLAFVLPMFALLVAIIWNFVDYITEGTRKALILAVLFIIVFIGGCYVAGNVAEASYAVDHQNEKIAEDNLKQKYNIVGVLWDETRTRAQTYDSLGEISVQDNDSNIIKFRYRVDKETREPYLLNESENTHVKANDLLRAKTEK